MACDVGGGVFVGEAGSEVLRDGRNWFLACGRVGDRGDGGSGGAFFGLFGKGEETQCASVS